MKKQFRTAMLSSICLLIVGVMSLTGVTYAWFTSGEKGTVSGMNVTVMSATGGILISQTGTGDWKEILELDETRTEIAPLSTVGELADGKVKFFTAAFSKTDSTKLITSAAEAATITDNTIQQDLWVKTDSPTDIQINLDGSYFSDVQNGAGPATKIGQAARMAIYQYGEANALTLLGILAPYSAAGDGSDIVTGAGEYIGVKAATSAEGADNTTADNTNFANVNAVAPNSVTITLQGTNNGGEATRLLVVIWLEGQDAECSNVNASGAFNTVLNFKKVAAVVQEPEEEVGE